MFASKPAIIALALGLGALPAARAYDLPQVNLGATSFVDSPPMTPPPWVLQQYLQYYTSDKLADDRGHSLPFPPTQSSDVLISMTQLTYTSPLRLGNSTLGFNAVLPAILSNSTDDGLDGSFIRGRNGMGDITFGPVFWFDPIMGPQGPRFSHRIELDAIAPTGAYDSKNSINPGSNAWAFDPYWSATFWATPRWSMSLRLHYLWSGRNDDPPASLGPGTHSLQGGQAVHANFATEYQFFDTLAFGVAGYWLKQTTDSKINGDEVSGRREKVTALGPGALWRPTRTDMFYFNAYHEFDVENRPQGSRFVVRYMKLFD